MALAVGLAEGAAAGAVAAAAAAAAVAVAAVVAALHKSSFMRRSRLRLSEKSDLDQGTASPMYGTLT